MRVPPAKPYAIVETVQQTVVVIIASASGQRFISLISLASKTRVFDECSDLVGKNFY